MQPEVDVSMLVRYLHEHANMPHFMNPSGNDINGAVSPVHLNCTSKINEVNLEEMEITFHSDQINSETTEEARDFLNP